VWRPTYFDELHGVDVDTARQGGITGGHPYLYDWKDVGITFSEFIAHLRVNGENLAGDPKSGTASAAATTPAGNRRKEITTFIANDADCGISANRLIRRIGTPVLQHVYDVRVYLDKYVKDLTGKEPGTGPGGVFTETERQRMGWQWARARPGDQVQWFDSTDNPWPAAAEAIETELAAIIGAASYSTTFSLVTGATWTWHPYRGWTCSKSMVPDNEILDDEE
jgi:hypothetical protein